MPDGLLVIDKPEGPTSHDVVARLRRVLGERRIGHTGTLDPLATGVLALLVGRATRLAQYLSVDDKHYLATIRFGVATTTYDREGDPIGAVTVPPDLTRERIENVLDRFRGTFLQAPPAFSAKKVAGISAHRLARRGAATALAAVPVTVTALDIVCLDGADLSLAVHASAGFYVRSLANDLGEALGCGAHLRALRRTAAGTVTLDDAVPLAAVEENPEFAASRIRPLASLLSDWPAIRVTMSGAEKVKHGAALAPGDCDEWLGASAGRSPAPAVSVRVLGPDGDLVALAAWLPAAGGDAPGNLPRTSGLLHPRVVLV